MERGKYKCPPLIGIILLPRHCRQHDRSDTQQQTDDSRPTEQQQEERERERGKKRSTNVDVT